MPEKEFASKGVAGTGLGLGIAGTALALLDRPGGLLNNILGGGPSPMMMDKMNDLQTENTLLKSQRYTDAENRSLRDEICGLRVEQVKQGEKINCIGKEMNFREQIVEGKIAQVAQTANCGITNLQSQLQCLQNTVNGITSTFVPAGKVTPLPAPNPFPPVPPYSPYPYPYPFPVIPPTVNSGTSGGTTEATGG